MIPQPLPTYLLRNGTKLNTAYSTSEVIADFDFETFSPAGYIWDAEKNKWEGKGLFDVGAAVYSEHSDAEVISLAYNLKDGTGIHIWTPEKLVSADYSNIYPKNLFEYLENGGLIEAWNASFEVWIWQNICVPKYEFPELPLNQVRCAMAKSRAFSLPGRLANAGAVLNTKVQKDKDGDRLIKKFCIPQNITKTNNKFRIYPKDDPIDAEKFLQYNIKDIVTEAEISALVPDLSEFELKIWQLDQEINRRGIGVDLDTVNYFIRVIENNFKKFEQEIFDITGGQVSTGSEIAKIRQWAKTQDVELTNLTKDNVIDILQNRWDLPQNVRRVLEIRQLLGYSSIKKLYRFRDSCTKNNRIHDLFIYHGAHTGRWAGADLQSQNLPSPTLKYSEIESAIDTTEYNSPEYFNFLYKNPLGTISSCLRNLLIAKPGYEIICSDFSAIEAVVLAVLANEQWRLDIFKTHGKIYEASAAKISGVSLEEILNHKKVTGEHHPLRKLGKVAELASGYQGSIGAWKRFKADQFLSDSEIQNAVNAWRDASPNIVNLWYGIERAAKNAICNPGQKFTHSLVSYIKEKNVLYCILPSGRRLCYHDARLEKQDGRDKIIFWGWESTTKSWAKQNTYGGKLTENIDQAISRDICANAALNLNASGYPVILHAHDEIAAEVLKGTKTLKEFEQIMSTMPAWAEGWPIKAQGGWVKIRYGKYDDI